MAPATLTFEHVNSKIEKKGSTKAILEDVSGTAQPGRLLAVRRHCLDRVQLIKTHQSCTACTRQSAAEASAMHLRDDNQARPTLDLAHRHSCRGRPILAASSSLTVLVLAVGPCVLW